MSTAQKLGSSTAVNMWLRCLTWLALVVALASCLDVTPVKESTKVTEGHTEEKEKGIREVEKTTEHDRRKPVVLPTQHMKEPIFKHPIKDGKISGAVLVPLGLGQISGSGHLTSQNTFSIEVFRSQVVKITKQIEELRASLQLLLTKYQSQRSASMKAIITKYKSGIQRLRSDKLRIEGLIKCTLNPALSGCGGSGVKNPSMPYPMKYPNQIKYPQVAMPQYPQVSIPQYPQVSMPQYTQPTVNAQNMNWAQISAQLAMMGRQTMTDTREKEKIVNGNAGVNYGTISIGATEKKIISQDTEEVTDYVDNDYRKAMKYVGSGLEMMNYGYGVQDYGLSSEYNMEGYGPRYYKPGFGGRQPFVPGYYPGSQGYMNLGYFDQGNMNYGMNSYGKESYNMMTGMTDLTSSEFLGSFEGGSLLESSLVGEESLEGIGLEEGLEGFDSMDISEQEGYGPLIGVFLPGQDAAYAEKPGDVVSIKQVNSRPGKPRPPVGDHDKFPQEDGNILPPGNGLPNKPVLPPVGGEPLLPPRIGEGQVVVPPAEEPDVLPPVGIPPPEEEPDHFPPGEGVKPPHGQDTDSFPPGESVIPPHGEDTDSFSPSESVIPPHGQDTDSFPPGESVIPPHGQDTDSFPPGESVIPPHGEDIDSFPPGESVIPPHGEDTDSFPPGEAEVLPVEELPLTPENPEGEDFEGEDFGTGVSSTTEEPIGMPFDVDQPVDREGVPEVDPDADDQDDPESGPVPDRDNV